MILIPEVPGVKSHLYFSNPSSGYALISIAMQDRIVTLRFQEGNHVHKQKYLQNIFIEHCGSSNLYGSFAMGHLRGKLRVGEYRINRYIKLLIQFNKICYRASEPVRRCRCDLILIHTSYNWGCVQPLRIVSQIALQL